MSIDITKPVKLVSPQKVEETLVFKVINFNDVTQRCVILPVNLDGFYIVPTETVSLNELANI